MTSPNLAGLIESALPSTAANPNESAYERGRFDGVMEYQRNLLAALRGVSDEPGAGWKPIESAPKDGTLLIFACKNWPHVMCGKPVPVKIGGWDAPMAHWHIFGASWEPTHWQLAPVFAAPDPAMPDTQSREGEKP